MIAPHVIGGADEETASPENKKKAAGLPATPQEFNYGEHLELMAELNQEETYPERANFYLEEYYATSDPDRHQQLSCDLFREFEIVIEPMDQLTLPNNIPPQSDRI